MSTIILSIYRHIYTITRLGQTRCADAQAPDVLLATTLILYYDSHLGTRYAFLVPTRLMLRTCILLALAVTVVALR